MTSYDDWARAFHGGAFLRRSAERNAAFLLPHLRPGQRLLDVGCGPGAITEGLAAAVAPGEAVGVDRDEVYISLARSQRSTSTNVRYEVGDAYALPFPDGSFDVVFLHAVLQHLDEPGRALAEVRRVLRAGGLVAVGDLDMDAYLLHPRSPDLDQALAVDRAGRRCPDVGRRLPELLGAAGFVDVELTVVANTAIGPAAAGVAESSAARFEAEPYVERAVAAGWASPGDGPRLAAAWRAWGVAPGATFASLWCQALGRAG